MRILLIRFSSIGDIVLTTAAIRCLRKRYPEAIIDFLTKDQFVPVLSENPYLSEVVRLKDNLYETAKDIIKREYDLIIDWHNNLRSNWLIQLLPENIPVIRYPKMSWKKWWSILLKRKLYGNGHVVDQYFEPLRALGVENDGKGLDYFIHPDEEVKKAQLPFTHLAGYAVFCLGATHFTKKWPDEHWMELCSKIRIPIILIGGKTEAALGEKLAAIDPYKIINKCGIYSLGQSASVIQKAKLVVTHDTGMMHIAAAFNKKTISIWGGTVPWLGFKPYHTETEKSIIIEQISLSCRPCSKYGRASCPKEHFRCMKDITPDAIIQVSGIETV
jgi:ADP-heptose:LPS heptosyltransferase